MEFCPDLRRALKTGGWMTEAELHFLATIANKSELIYEIGSFVGRSTRALADNTKGIIYAIDSWKTDNLSDHGALLFRTNEEIFNQFYCTMHDHINSEKVIPTFCNWEDFHPSKCADFIFIDGDHRYESVKRDIEKALNLIKSPGILAGHDYADSWVGVRTAVDEMFGNINLVDSIWWVEMK